jgi:RHS repeat-associated protein
MRYGKDKQTEKYIHGIGHESTEKLNQWKETEKTFYTHNELGSQIREYDDKGNTTNSYEYDIFGIPSFREDSYNYTGYTNGSSTNLMFAQARYYLPEIGRFISEDSYKGTMPDTQSQNRYIYCTNNPLKYIDPTRHNVTEPWWYKMWQGAKAHKIVETYFEAVPYNKKISERDAEVYIPKGCNSLCGSGRADMVWFLPRSTEIYELKPISNYTKKSYNLKAKKQLDGYVNGMKLMKEKSPVKGTSWNPNGVVLPYSDNKVLKLFTDYKNDPGMVYYKIEDIGKSNLQKMKDAASLCPIAFSLLEIAGIQAMEEQAKKSLNPFDGLKEIYNMDYDETMFENNPKIMPIWVPILVPVF